jgi:hypothetical protein
LLFIYEQRDVLLAYLKDRLEKNINQINISKEKNIGIYKLILEVNTGLSLKNENTKEVVSLELFKRIDVEFSNAVYYYNRGSFLNSE